MNMGCKLSASFKEEVFVNCSGSSNYFKDTLHTMLIYARFSANRSLRITLLVQKYYFMLFCHKINQRKGNKLCFCLKIQYKISYLLVFLSALNSVHFKISADTIRCNKFNSKKTCIPIFQLILCLFSRS